MQLIRYKLEKDIETITESSKSYLKERYQEILENDKPVSSKADYIALSILSLDTKLKDIDEEITQLRALKEQLKSAKEIAKEVGAEVFKEYGIDKLEGLRISSLTIQSPVATSKVSFEVLKPQELIEAGFKRVVLDMDKVKECYHNGEYLDLIHHCCKLSTSQSKPVKKIKINKRRSKSETTREAA